jgi:Zn-dependent protease
MILFIIHFIILIFSVIIHEISHGFVADLLGDPTARISKRLTLNPIPHIDPLMTLAIPLLLIMSGSHVVFGAAKPVPVDPFNFREPKKDLALTAVSGPIANLLIAFCASLILRLYLNYAGNTNIDLFFAVIVRYIVELNVFLAVFNLLPIPPMDGFKFVGGILPDNLASEWFSLERYGMVLLFILLFAFPSVINQFVFPVSTTIINLMLH